MVLDIQFYPHCDHKRNTTVSIMVIFQSLIHTCLFIVDMQRYYLDASSDFYRYFESISPGCMSYILNRCFDVVIPNIVRLRDLFREKDSTLIYLRLCGKDPERKDLHRFFRESWQRGKKFGYESVYPLASEPMADVISEIAPTENDIIIDKPTFSPFSSTNIEFILKNKGIKNIVFTGLATSQCVETTARDASDRGFEVIHIEDAQADYTEEMHHASLYSSQGVCGGAIYRTEDFQAILRETMNF